MTQFDTIAPATTEPEYEIQQAETDLICIDQVSAEEVELILDAHFRGGDPDHDPIDLDWEMYVWCAFLYQREGYLTCRHCLQAATEFALDGTTQVADGQGNFDITF